MKVNVSHYKLWFLFSLFIRFFLKLIILIWPILNWLYNKHVNLYMTFSSFFNNKNCLSIADYDVLGRFNSTQNSITISNPFYVALVITSLLIIYPLFFRC